MISLNRLRMPGYVLCLACLLPILIACATQDAPGNTDDGPLRARAVTENSHGIRVSAAVLGADDRQRMFGADSRLSNAQPVWVEVANGTSQWLWLFPMDTGGGFLLPFEVTWSRPALSAGRGYARIDDRCIS
jgi:hypothetical protein